MLDSPDRPDSQGSSYDQVAYSCAVMERQRGVSGHGGALARVAVYYIWLSDNLAHTILTPF